MQLFTRELTIIQEKHKQKVIKFTLKRQAQRWLGLEENKMFLLIYRKMK
jgi:hypothetical protein